MGKRLMRSYKVFILFLLMSMSVISFGKIGTRTRIEKIDAKNFSNIELSLLTITNMDVETLNLLKVKETREEQEKTYSNIATQKLILEKVKINGVTYNLDENNKTKEEVPEYNGKKQYVYGWTGIYKTKFIEEKGKERTVSFDAMRTMKNGVIYPTNKSKKNKSGKYKEPTKIEPTPESGDQWIYSQITRDSLIKSNKYIVDFYENIDTIKTIDEDGSLDDLLKSDDNYGDTDLTQDEKERYSYNGISKSILEFKIDSNIEEPQKSKFNLTIVGNDGVYRRMIDENYKIPVPVGGIKEVELEPSKNTFIYTDDYEFENIKSYKYQEVVFRLYTESKHDGIRPIKRIEDNELSDNNYVDFVFENNGSTQELEKNGIKGRFIEGKFELMGLEDGKLYKLDFYTLRYRNDKNNNTGNYVAVTYETSLDFTGKNISSIDETIWLEDIDISEYKIIKLNMITVTKDDLKELNILNLNEARSGETKSEKDTNIDTNKVELKKIWIEEKEYEVINNQITLDNGDQKYVYKWTGSYDTEFDLEKGETREINFLSRGKYESGEIFEGGWVMGKYIEPTPVELDTGAPHQSIMFEFNSGKEFKGQNYKIEDRVLSPERKGYKRLKTVDYEGGLDDILYGRNSHNTVKEFNFNNGKWNYPETTSSEGLIIEKTITEAKGNLKGEDGSELIFYTDQVGSGIEKLEESGNKATFRWNEGPLNSNGEILNYDKVIFRIVKGTPVEVDGVPKFYWNPYENTNSINYIDETDEGNNRLEAFLYGDDSNKYNEDYVDLVLDATTSKTITLNNAIISYEQTNKELRVVGLPVRDYTIQFYSIKRGHDGSYKIITYENYDTFVMDIPDIASSDFEKENNIHKIDFITVGENKGEIEVNVNFITKMEREVELTTDNLIFGKFNMEETNKDSGKKEGIGKDKIVSLKESEMKKFLFPLDVVFVIDNSGSMQNEIDNVKNGLSDFGKELLDRGFDVKYNLITFGPRQNKSTIGEWYSEGYATATYDKGYMAIYKNKWFNGITIVDKIGDITRENRREKELEELKDAFSKIRAKSGYYGGQENSAWGIHYAIEKLRTNGRYLSYSGEIVEGRSKGYMPSEKMIIFLTDENMDTGNIGSLGYTSDNVLKELSKKLVGEKFNGMPDNIDLNGIFHIRRRGNDAPNAKETLTTYDEIPGLGYYYSTGKRKNNDYWEEWDDNEIPILGIDPSDRGDIYHTDFKYYNTANNFFMYEMGNRGQHVSKALTLAINNLGIIQRWDLSYMTPFNEYDGTTRIIDFELINLVGKDGVVITRDIKNLNEEEDKKYTVKEEKLALEFDDPSIDNLKLSILDGKGTISFLGKARYTDYDESNQPIVVEDMIKEYKLDVLDSNNKLLFSRNTDSIDMKLSEDGWLEIKATKNDISNILEGRKKSWVEVINNSGKDILSYIDKARYTIEGDKTYNIEFMTSETNKIISKNLKKSTSTSLALVVNKKKIEIEEKEFEKIVGNRSDTWYELNDISTNVKGLDNLISNDFEKIEINKYRIKLRDLGLVKLLSDKGGNRHDIELKISQTKLTKLSDKEKLGDTFGDQGWYQFKIQLTDDEMKKLIESKTVKLTEKINLEATIVTDLFNKIGILKDVEIDLSVPKITNVKLKNKTLFSFLDTMHTINKSKAFENPEEYSGYDREIVANYIIPTNGSYGKIGDNIYLKLIVEGKNIDEYDVATGIAIDGWSNPKITEIIVDPNDEMKKFDVVWKSEVISNNGMADIIVRDDIENQYGFTGLQEVKVLNVDNTDIEVKPIIVDVKPIDNIYYVNSNYSIDLGTIDFDFRAGIVTMKYDNTKADSKENGSYYGKSDKYYKIDGENIFGGGEEDSSISVKIDVSNKNSNGAHKTDGEYRAQIYGMSRSGKLKGITDYSKNNFKTIMKENINNLDGEEITIRVDTIAPKIEDIVVSESISPSSDDNNYYFDISFDVEDFNARDKKLSLDSIGGYDLIVSAGTVIKTKPEDGKGNPVKYTIKVDKSTVKEAIITEVTIVAVDKAGNETKKEVKIRIPKDIKIKTYEELYQIDKSKLIKDGYKFTKGGLGSNIPNPAIYVIVPASDPDDENKVGKLKLQRLDGNGGEEGSPIEISVPGGNAKKEIEITFNFVEGANIVRITPISTAGIEGKSKELKFVVDTKINTSYLDTEGIISNLDNREINIKLSEFEELSGLNKYSYVLSSGRKKEKDEDIIVGGKYLTPTKESGLSDIPIRVPSSFSDGSRLNFEFTVEDRLGHKKTFEKTYFIPKQSAGIIAMVSGEVKQRKSKIKIVTEGRDDKFGIESSIDGSSEQEEEPIIGGTKN